jgi:hypothetical protein|nr:MAG: hypothetical protein J07AB56_11570 [Candidatus Nanosalinarum sp. J07AB56]
MELTSNVKVTRLEAALTILVAATGIIHIGVGLTAEYQMLTLAGAGFIGGAGLFLAGPRLDDAAGLEQGFNRAALSGLVLPYTGYQFVAYYTLYGFTGSPVAAADKLVQTGILAVSSLYLYRKL